MILAQIAEAVFVVRVGPISLKKRAVIGLSACCSAEEFASGAQAGLRTSIAISLAIFRKFWAAAE